MNRITRLTYGVALAGAAWCQVSNEAFEVAAIKRSDPTADIGQMMRDPRIVALADPGGCPQNHEAKKVGPQLVWTRASDVLAGVT